MYIPLKHIIRLILLTGFAMPLWAQTTYQVRGQILDAVTGESLPSATVRIRNTQTGTAADLKGNFVLGNIRVPKTELEIAFIGYETVILPLDFSLQQYDRLIVRLKPSVQELEAVRISGNAEGQVKAILDQKVAANIKNIVSAEQIEQFPDLNAAEAIQRIPGITLQRDQGEGRFVQLRGTPPEYTNFNVNGEQIPSPEGNVRYVGLDVISADQIEFIEVTKVLTPDMDADAIGGTVNIITKTARSEIPDIKASLAAGYNNLRQSGNYQMQLSYAQRKGKFGFSMNGSYYLNNQGSDNMEFEYDKLPYRGTAGEEEETNYHLLYTEMQLRHYDITRTRTGLSGSLDYQFGENSMLYLRGMYNSFNDQETRRRKIYTLDDPINDTYFTYGGIEHDLKDRIKKQAISTVNLGGKNRIGKSLLDYEASYSLATEEQPDRLEVRFEDDVQSLAIKIDKSDPQWPRVYFPNTSDSIAAYDYEEYEMDEMLLLAETVKDQNMTLKFNFEIPFSFGAENKGSLKFGSKYRYKDKERDNVAQVFTNFYETSPIYFGTAPELNLLTVADDFSESNLLNQDYAIDHMPGPAETRSFYEAYPQHFVFARKETMRRSNEEDYQAREDIFALYGMFRIDLNRLMLLGGLRYEHTGIDYTGRTINMEGETFDDVVDTLTDSRSHDFFLPQLQMKYQLSDKWNVRAAVTRTFSRPNFEDVLPYRQQDRKEVKYGNPDLQYPVSLNFDILTEYYFQKNSILSGGLFLKKIDDFIFFYVLHAYEEDPSTGASKYVMEIPLNGDDATVFGAEAMGQFKLDFLPGWAKNLGVYTNYTYTWSNASIFKRYPANEQIRVIGIGEDYQEYFNTTERENITLPGQAMHSMNLALYYESPRIYAKLSANYHDAFLDRLGADSDLDEYYDAAWHLDLTANYALTDHLKVFADVINLTNAPLRYFVGTPENTMKQEYYSWWGRLGLKLEF